MSQPNELHIVEGATTHADASYWNDVFGQQNAPQHQSAFLFPPSLMASSQPPPTGPMATITVNSTPERDQLSPEIFSIATPVVNARSPGSGALLPAVTKPLGLADRDGQ